MKHEHYFKDVSHLSQIDVYRVLQLFGVTDPAIGHAVKKLLCSGQRGTKDAERDWREAVDSIERALQMLEENCKAKPERVHEYLARCPGTSPAICKAHGCGIPDENCESPKASDDWISWVGASFLPTRGEVFVRLRDGSEQGPSLAHLYRWVHAGTADDIMAYRLAK